EVALISASLFAVHPAHAESVAWVSGITDPLMAIFLLPAFYFYLRYRKTGRNSLMAAAIGCYFLALFCKETALALPLAVAYCELFHFKDAGPFKRRVARLLALAGLFVIPTVIYIIMRYIALSRPLGNVPLRPLGSALATIPLAVAKYLALLVFPTGYSYQHPTPFVESFFSMRFLGPAFLIAVLAGAVFLIRSQAVKLAAAWFIITLAPALYAIRQFGAENVVQERYLYLPSIGFCLVVALAIERIAGSSLFAARSRIVAISISAALIAVWGAVLIRQNRVWDEDITLFKNCVEVDPDSPVARIALARAYFDAGRTRDAEAEIQTALQIDPNNAGALVTLSYFAHKEGKLEKSIEYLKSAASNVEESHIAHTVLGTIYLNTGLIYWELKDMSRAEEYLLRSIETWPRPVGWYHTGNFYVDQGRYEEARTIYERSLEQLPRWYAPIHLKLGQVYERLGQSARAKAAYERYLEVTPSSLETRNEAMLRLRIQKLND
ncbi:MAG TPA: tetratricopeptide repeat protein, partial [Blastocatellia bacterium]|nr:tetratricopeptide repeat protein [Blastocatellia bacterium]